MSNNKNDVAWEKLFDRHRILEEISLNGYVQISSVEINIEREARLMTKFDNRSQLPDLFLKNKLSILPISRGTYIIAPFESYCDFRDEAIEVAKIDFPFFLESLDYRDITSEATAINCAFVTKILHDFTGEQNLVPTVSGRMSSSSFSFDINMNGNLFNVAVNNSQIEVDGGYEGDFSLNLIEAKNYLSDDFLIRQLYYPYKLWASKITKKVRPIFLTYTNGIFHLREYSFENINHYNSLRLVKEKKYAVQEGEINIEVIQSILDEITIVPEPCVPFPQANSFERVINLCELLKQRVVLSKEEITENYGFDARQTDYYSNAAKYLGLVYTQKQDEKVVCFLTEQGQIIFSLPIVDRQIAFLKLILSHKAFNETLREYFKTGNIPSKELVVTIMRNSNLYRINKESTYFRRASTICGWINWIIEQVGE